MKTMIVTESMRNGMRCWYSTTPSRLQADVTCRSYTFRLEGVLLDIFQFDGRIRYRVSAKLRREIGRAADHGDNGNR